jgi:Aerotolerance regulator N-terminal
VTFLAPGYLVAAVAVAAAIAGLHFIVVRQPRSTMLPTARFVPDSRATTVAPARRPSDVPLMLLRMLIVLAAGAGLATPVLSPSRGAEARVILVDVSRSARDSLAIRDSVRALYRDGDAIVLFDSSARLVTAGATDSIGMAKPSVRRGNLSGALIAALRAGSALRGRADSLELVIVSPFAREELDAATDSIRALWPGRAKLVRVGADVVDATSSGAGKLETNATADDPLAVTAAVARPSVAGNVTIDRNSTLAAQTSTTDVSISWPASGRPTFAVSRSKRDTIGGVVAVDAPVIAANAPVVAANAPVVAAFDREWMYPPDSLRGGEVVARWSDGEPAAIEKPDHGGCVRSVSIPVTGVGDLAIRREFVRFVAALSRPCATRTALAPAHPEGVAKLEGKGGLAPRTAFRPLTNVRSVLSPWLFALAIAAAIAELLLRRRGRVATVAMDARRQRNEARAA